MLSILFLSLLLFVGSIIFFKVFFFILGILFAGAGFIIKSILTIIFLIPLIPVVFLSLPFISLFSIIVITLLGSVISLLNFNDKKYQ